MHAIRYICGGVSDANVDLELAENARRANLGTLNYGFRHEPSVPLRAPTKGRKLVVLARWAENIDYLMTHLPQSNQ